MTGGNPSLHGFEVTPPHFIKDVLLYHGLWMPHSMISGKVSCDQNWLETVCPYILGPTAYLAQVTRNLQGLMF